jgi:serine/threonine protein kinase
MARDQLQNRIVALKCLAADFSAPGNKLHEIEIQRHLASCQMLQEEEKLSDEARGIEEEEPPRLNEIQQKQEKDSGWLSTALSFFRRNPLPDTKCDDRRPSSFFPTILDEFEFRGINGIHRCIVTEAIGPSLQDLFGACMRNFVHGAANSKLPLEVLRKVASQLAHAVAKMHLHHVVHGGAFLFRHLWDSADKERRYSPGKHIIPDRRSGILERLGDMVEFWLASRSICRAERQAFRQAVRS